MTVSLISCVYGNHDCFIDRWEQSVRALRPRPDEIVLASDQAHAIRSARVISAPCDWKHPQAFYLHQAVLAARGDWVWIVDIDDEAMPDALEGIEKVGADVWLLGFQTDGEVILPESLTNDEYLNAKWNIYTGASAFRKDAYLRAGGFPDVAYQDWALWRRMAYAGATFEVSTRAHFKYNRHGSTRTAMELTEGSRGAHLAEMETLDLVA